MDYPKSVPGVGLVNGEFVDEDEVSGAQGSLIPAKWGNDVTKEILGVLAEAGIEPDEANPAQLRAAVVAIVDKVAPVATKAEAETNDEATANNVKRMTPLRVLQAIKARLVNATETVVGMLRIGTQAEVDAGTLDDVAVTPKKLRMGFASSLTTNGWQRLPSGLIIQWASVNVPINSSVSVSFPFSFPVKVLAHSLGSLYIGSGVTNEAVISLMALSTSGFTVKSSRFTGSDNDDERVTVIAIGY